MALDPIVEQSLLQHGFAQVVVTLEPEPAAAAAPVAAAAAAAAPAPPAALRYFLGQVPAAAGGDAVSLAAAAAEGRAEPPPVRHFPRLGVALGYVDAAGASGLDADPTVADVSYAYQPSLIRPLGIAAATASAKFTWGLRRLRIPKLWTAGLTGAGVRVGHLDTGVDGAHPALAGRIATFAEFDLDGNQVPGAVAHDSGDHGTHTAGTICGGKAGSRSIGVAPGASLVSGLVIEGNALVRVLAGMDWILGENVRILAMSLGFRDPVFPGFFSEIMRRVREHNVLPVIAIGNEGAGTSRSPGSYPESLSVGAITSSDTVWTSSSSNTFSRPSEPNQPNVVAPGVSVISAVPGGGLASMSGTSMATPHVAGVAALLFESKPAATAAQVERAIQSTCTLLPGVSPLRQGLGLVNPEAALAVL